MAYWDDPGYQKFMRETYGGNWYTDNSKTQTQKTSAQPSTPTAPKTPSTSTSSTREKSSTSSTATKTPSDRELKNLTEALAQAKRTYEEAKARGDTATMETARRVADVLRSQGASETEANKIVYGNEKGWYAGWTPTTTSTPTRPTPTTSTPTQPRTPSSTVTATPAATGDVYKQLSYQYLAQAAATQDPTERLAWMKRLYEAAKQSGNVEDMEAARSAADYLRSIGASEAEANRLVYGNEKGWYPGWVDKSAVYTLGQGTIGYTDTGTPTFFTPSGQTTTSPPASPIGQGWQVTPGGQIILPAAQPQQQAPAQQVEQPPLQYQVLPRQAISHSNMLDIGNALADLQRTYANSPDTAAMLSRALDDFLRQLDTAQQALVSRFEGQISGVDPATQAALASLRETVKRQRDALMEELSRRGLLQSGIWLEMEDRLNRGELTAQQQLLGQRIADLQNQLNNALANLTNLRLSAFQNYSLEGIRQLQEEALRRQQAAERNLDRAINLYNAQRQYELNFLPYLTPTVGEMQGAYERATQSVGRTPSVLPGGAPAPSSNTLGTQTSGGSSNELVPARSYVENAGGQIYYDSKTGRVVINGQPIDPNALGGYIKNGVTYLPKNTLDQLLRRY